MGAILTAALWPREREPEYGGKKLSEWLRISFNTDSPWVASEAANAIRHIGTNALPYLVKSLRHEQPAGKRKLDFAAAYSKWPRLLVNNSIMTWLLGERGEGLVWTAIHGFGVLGPEAAPAVPELTQLMQDTNSAAASVHAMRALASIGKAGFPPLEAVLTNQASPAQLRINAVRGIWLSESDVHFALPALIRVLEDPDFTVREEATNAMRKIAQRVLERVGAQTNGNFRREN